MKIKELEDIDIKGKKIAIAMSGGVDSSVAALLLKQAGAEVFGVSMQIVPWSRCCLPEDLLEAKMVAKQLGIKHYLVDLKKEFKKTAIDYFVSESKKGRNPNPCVPCNQKIKFGELFKFAKKHGAEFFATGHYARIEKKKDNFILKRPLDIKKDQSYVLSMLPRKLFSNLIFPVGGYSKDEVRKIAKKNNIKLFSKPGNQDLCFLNKEKGDFINWWTNKNAKPGKIVDKDGNVLGKHNGLVHYTIGQRKGLGINSHKRFYVMEVNPKKNQIVIGEKKELYHKQFYVTKPNWVSIEKLTKPMDVEVLVRNKTEPQKAKILPEGKNIKVVPKKPIWALSPGQIAVFIKKDIVLGGGWIK